MKEPSSANVAQLIAPADDRRTFSRYALNMLAFVRLPERPAPALGDSAVPDDPALYILQAVSVKDLSMTGLFFYSTLAYPIGAELELCLPLDGAEFPATATVERRVRINNSLCGYGINFCQRRMGKLLRVSLAAFLLRRDCRVPQAARA